MWGSVAGVVRPSLVPHAHIDVVHAIGRPTTARTGDGLIIAGERRPQLTAAELVPRNGPRLVVLQAEPYEYEARMETDRDATARLKRLAHAVLQRSGAAVIVIPSLPPTLAAQVVEFLVKRLVHQQNSLSTVRVAESDLLRARADAAALIRTWYGWRALGGELAAELADDICVFSQEAR